VTSILRDGLFVYLHTIGMWWWWWWWWWWWDTHALWIFVTSLDFCLFTKFRKTWTPEWRMLLSAAAGVVLRQHDSVHIWRVCWLVKYFCIFWLILYLCSLSTLMLLVGSF